jgi:predicted phosphodiesterase
MRFIAVSDTHDNIPAIRELIDEVRKEKIDFIVHAGDIVSPLQLRSLQSSM